MKKITLTILLSLMLLPSFAQKDSITLNLSLNQAINFAYSQSIYSFRQKNMYLSKYWEFRSFRAEHLPLLSLKSTPINYQRSIISRYDPTKNDDVFTPAERVSSDASLKISQNITATGAKISASTSLQRIQNISSGKLSYYTTPLTIGISQSLNGFNQFKWRSKIEPLKFEQAKRQYLQNLQELSIKTTNSFFNLVSAEINLTIAKTNVSNTDTLYQIGQGRFKIGTVTQDELLDLELSHLNANMALAQAKVDLQQSRITLNSFLGFKKNIYIKCIIPKEIPHFKIKVSRAIDEAFANNPQVLQFKQQLLEADRDVAQTKGQNGINAGIYGDVGINKNTDDLHKAYANPFGNEQNLRITLDMPIVDWGLRKGKVQMAKSNKEVTEATVKQAKIDFEQDIFINVMKFNMQEQQVKIACKADTIAQMGYKVTKQRFLIDKVDVIKLNAARNSLDAAKRNYIQRIQSYWVNYFSIRKKTLFDFEMNKPLTVELDKLLQK